MAEHVVRNDPGAHLPALDGLRAVSILLVVASHAGFGHVVPGGLGVTLFFGISGFIITRLLLAEHAARGRIAFGAFYARRALRLSPPLLAYAACAGLAMLALGDPLVLAEWVAMLFYGANYYALWVGFPDRAGLAPHPFSILWSLAVEEHFYLLFPALLALLLRRGGFLAAMALGCAASLVWRVVVHLSCGAGGPEALCGSFPAYRIHMATDTRLDAMLYGCALAWLCRPGRMPPWLGRSWPFWLGGAGLLASLAVRDGFFRETLRHSVQSLCVALVIGPLLFAPGLAWARRWLSLGPVLLVGRMSYVLYLFHWLAVGLACAATGVAMRESPYPAAWYAAFLALTVLPTLAVHYGIERPTAAWRRRLRPAPAQPPGPGGGSLRMAASSRGASST